MYKSSEKFLELTIEESELCIWCKNDVMYFVHKYGYVEENIEDQWYQRTQRYYQLQNCVSETEKWVNFVFQWNSSQL
jgi:hypothetical protein